MISSHNSMYYQLLNVDGDTVSGMVYKVITLVVLESLCYWWTGLFSSAAWSRWHLLLRHPAYCNGLFVVLFLFIRDFFSLEFGSEKHIILSKWCLNIKSSVKSFLEVTVKINCSAYPDMQSGWLYLCGLFLILKGVVNGLTP